MEINKASERENGGRCRKSDHFCDRFRTSSLKVPKMLRQERCIYRKKEKKASIGINIHRQLHFRAHADEFVTVAMFWFIEPLDGARRCFNKFSTSPFCLYRSTLQPWPVFSVFFRWKWRRFTLLPSGVKMGSAPVRFICMLHWSIIALNKFITCYTDVFNGNLTADSNYQFLFFQNFFKKFKFLNPKVAESYTRWRHECMRVRDFGWLWL